MFFQQDLKSLGTEIWTVSELNERVSQCLQVNFPPLWVSGEIRGFTRAASGHWYFTLKDETGELSCAMFVGNNRRVGFIPKTGDHLEVHGQVSIYRARGSYQMVVDAVRRAGLGELYERFLRLKEKLQAEGLFDDSRKKPLRRLYTKIGIVTSLQAAALRDVLTTLRRRASYAKVTVFETAVQGEDAPDEIIAALRKADAHPNVEVILLVRGGGSIQDLWAFNDERLARTIVSLDKPVIVGVGHESDVTIADWVADLRAATPTAAAEHATESSEVLIREITQVNEAMSFAFKRCWTEASQSVDALMREMPDPAQKVQYARERLMHSHQLLNTMLRSCLRMNKQTLDHLSASLIHPTVRLISAQDSYCHIDQELTNLIFDKLRDCERSHLTLMDLITELSPQAILQKGYSYVTASDGRFIKRAQGFDRGEKLTIHWHDGDAAVTVIEKTH